MSPTSLLEIYSEVTGTEHATVTSIRRGLEAFARQSVVSSSEIKIINGHSESTGRQYYHRTAKDLRSNVMQDLSQHEGSVPEEREKLPEEVEAKRRKIEQKDDEERQKLAFQVLSRGKAKYSLGKQMKLTPDDRNFLQTFFSEERYRNLHGITRDNKFPGNLS